MYEMNWIYNFPPVKRNAVDAVILRPINYWKLNGNGIPRVFNYQ